MASERRSHEDYSIGWICALPKEQTAAIAMLDKRHPDLAKPTNDSNSYTLGSIGEHNIVIACLPLGQYGTNSAANVATLMITSFPSVRIGLLVGIGGGVPLKVRLGDVVVSTPGGQYPGVVQWDRGKATGDGTFERTGSLSNPPSSLLTALSKLKTEHELTGSMIPSFLKELETKYPRLAKKYLKSDLHQDFPFKADCAHINGPFMNAEGPTGGIEFPQEEEEEEEAGSGEEIGESCQFCDKSKLLSKKSRSMRVHYGLIASGNRVIKDGLLRDELNNSLGGGVLCFEMEAAGLMNNFPCLVIRGICDYCDSHKNNIWQEHAAAVAAAFAKELLGCIQPNDVKNERLIRDVMSEVKRDIQRVYEKVVETKKHWDTLRDDDEAKKQMETLNWLTPLNFPLLQHDYFRRCAPDTGQEFLKSEEVQNWLSASKQTIFCQGHPGAGKTFQMAILVNYLVEKYRDDGTVGVAYIYYNFKRHHDQNAEQMLASLIKQLAQISTPFPEAVHLLRDRHCPMKTRPFLGELSDTLATLILSFSRVFILIDALDEGADSERTRFLDEVFSVQEKTGLNLFATSRTINNIAAGFEGRSIPKDISPTRHDIFQFLNARMSALPLFVAKDAALQKEIRECVESAIGGMFLLAQLYIDSLAGKRSPESLKTALGDLRHASSSPDRSKVLDAAYDKSMERIQQLKGDLPRDALLILSWIVKARRQIKLAEIKEALAVEKGASKLNPDNIPLDEHIIEACASLVIIEGDTIELVHYTAQEYFERPNNKWMQKAQINITNTCMAYLSLSTFRDESCISQEDLDRRIEHNPFYSYSAEYWAYHTNEALAQGLEVSRVVEFLGYGLIRGSWYQDLLYGHSQNIFRPEFVPKHLTALHVVALFGLHDVAAKLLEQGNSPNDKDSLLRLPIWWAAWSGNAQAAELLLDGTTDLDKRDLEYGSTPLLIAARRGHKTVVELLLRKYNIESKDNSGWTSLNVAAQFGNKAVFDLLVDKGADIEVKDNDCQTPLAIAARLGHMNAVKWLLEKGADIEATDSKTRTPLMLATMGGHEGVVRHLIEKGAQMEVMDDEKQTPLAAAIQKKLMSILEIFPQHGLNINGKMGNDYTPLTHVIKFEDDDIAKWLIEKGANLDEQDGHQMTPLLTAIANGNKDIVKFLVEQGAGLEVKGGSFGCTPLITATKENRPDIVEFLIQKGAHLEGQDGEGGTALLTAAGYGCIKILQLLIREGADLEAKSDYGNTPLINAASWGQTKVIQLLLDNNANIEAKNNNGSTPLYGAARYGKFKVIQLLLTNNANIEAKGYNGNTPLGIAALEGKSKAIQLLLDNNANIEAKNNNGETPLGIAARDGMSEVIQLLLANNANIEAKNNNGETPLGMAARYGMSEVIQLLLANNANIEAKDNDGETPLGVAARYGKSEVIQLLLANNANIEAKDNDGDTPLGIAAYYGKSEVIQPLLINNANIEAKNNEDVTPLGRAVYWGTSEAVQLLLANNANIEAKSDNGETPLCWAIHSGRSSIAKLLLDFKASPCYRNASGETLMHIAVAKENLDSVHALLAFEAVSVDEKDNNGRTPLSHATRHGTETIVKALLNSGKAEANSRDNKGRTPLSYAASYSVARALLKKHKVDVNSKDKLGRTPLWYATKAGNQELIKLLRKHGAKSKRSWF